MKKLILVLLCLLSLVGCGSKENKPEEIIIENQEPKSEITSIYYYNQINDVEKEYYDILLEASKEYKNNFSSSLKYDDESFARALYAFSYDYPLYYWWRNGYKVSYTDSGFEVISIDEQKDFEENVNKLVEIKNNILKECVVENNYQTIKNIHDYLINNIDYDSNNKLCHNIVGALIEKKAVCDGYALSFKYLLNEAGFNCNAIEGNAIDVTEIIEHAWNIVELNNKWYLCDLTWDDPASEEDNGVPILYNYFMISDEQMYSDHFLVEGYTYPECRDDSLSYINMPGFYMKEYDEDKIDELLIKWIKQGYKDFYFKFTDYEKGIDAHNYLLENGNFPTIFEKTSSNFDITYGGDLNINSKVLHIYYREVENN